MEDIEIDATQFSIVVICTCGWRVFAGSRAGAWDLAGQHLKAAHNDSASARRAAQAARDVRYRERLKRGPARRRPPRCRRDENRTTHPSDRHGTTRP